MANEEHLTRLRQGVDSWNKWIKTHPDIEPDLRGADLSSTVLLKVDLSRTDLYGADLSRAILCEANFYGTNLERANLIETDLRGACFSEAKLIGVNLSRANLSRADFVDADLRGAILNGSDFREAILSGTNLSGVNLSGIDLSRSDLSGADFSKANLSESNLKEALLDGAKFNWADLSRANLSSIDLSRTNLAMASLREANLSATKLTRANLIATDLTNTDLSGADLRNAELTTADLSGANLNIADLRAATLLGACFYGARLTGAKLWETQRSGWTIKDVICESASWDKLGNDLIHYKPGEFERLYSGMIDTFSPEIEVSEVSALPAIIQLLEEIYKPYKPRFKLTIDAEKPRYYQRRLQVFLCYASDDRSTVLKLYERLQDEGINPWLDKRKLLGGQDWNLEIKKAIKGSDIILVCLSDKSVSKAGFIQKEIKYALDVADEQPEGAIYLVPLKLENCDVPSRLKHLQWIDYFEKDGFEELSRILKEKKKSIHQKEEGQDEVEIVEKLRISIQELQDMQPYVKRELDNEIELRKKYEQQLEFARELLESGMSKYKISGTVYGPVGDQAQITNQTIYNQTDLAAIRDLITEIQARRGELEEAGVSGRIDELDTSLKSIKEQLDAKTPDSSIIKGGLQSVKNVLEGATGSVVASGWLAAIQRFLG